MKIDDLIKDNIDFFNSEEPDDGHFERFTQKLAKPEQKIIKIKFTTFIKAAGILVLMTLSGLWTYEHFLQKPEIIKLGDISPEYREAENYYLNTINTEYLEIKQFKFQDKDQKRILLKELQDMDSVYVQLQKDLKLNPNDERVINAMINHYQLKIEVMNQIISQLKEINNQIKQFEHENKDI